MSDKAKKKILIVDDDAEIRRLLAMICEDKINCAVLEAENGKKALEIIEKESPDLVLLDYSMPEMDGEEIIKIIRSAPKTADLKIIMISGSIMDDKFEEVAQKYATAYLKKTV